jgi:hypothetical protein
VFPITCSCSETCEITTKEIPSASTLLYKEHVINKHEGINGIHVFICVKNKREKWKICEQFFAISPSIIMKQFFLKEENRNMIWPILQFELAKLRT